MMLPAENERSMCPADVYRAEGVVAERLGVDIESAAEMLRHEAATREITMVEIAREVLTGDWSHHVLDPWGSC
ncbi:ANTAR domain-containing protein [Actinomycetospora succinea]|uniref:ANTAR domain-containing protein n=1 Tax=Actinomycetospora succinea TaxID=663603 RepID=A0A4R6V8X3_9PSEU|nr:ANTAR domain-containing protein [Actinomycetospora succinea]TDQ52848.1 ANTAR domain-containing protein [Actinomycetospora succinea]